ncbi:hypothetical protein EVAR_36895_1 [Eumeta japonica]|uniref:Uncharacterized protein n=1 Tax=Eumeta variegata TaxID=151549 RepID=A0A4C1WTT6_EUMVA|nr:hypothetical protein EVAR_36895_1 [Eumeta japonica]
MCRRLIGACLPVCASCDRPAARAYWARAARRPPAAGFRSELYVCTPAENRTKEVFVNMEPFKNFEEDENGFAIRFALALVRVITEGFCSV